MRRISGFTLIELLIVIAILTLLAGILFTVFAGAREKARQTHCMNNLKQLGAAILLYKQDYDGGWPRQLTCVYPSYVTDAQVMVCPDDGTNERFRQEYEKLEGKPYATYPRFGDGLPTLSGYAVDRLMASPGVDCDSLAGAILNHRFADRMPLNRCYCHLTPGADCAGPGFLDDYMRAGTTGCLIELRQDGSVESRIVDARALLSTNTRIPGLSTEEWLRLLAQVKDQLAGAGKCQPGEG